MEEIDPDKYSQRRIEIDTAISYSLQDSRAGGDKFFRFPSS